MTKYHIRAEVDDLRAVARLHICREDGTPINDIYSTDTYVIVRTSDEPEVKIKKKFSDAISYLNKKIEELNIREKTVDSALATLCIPVRVKGAPEPEPEPEPFVENGRRTRKYETYETLVSD